VAAAYFRFQDAENLYQTRILIHMETNGVLEKLTTIFRDVLDNDDIELSPATTADDIEEWDSLNHIQLVVAIEKAWKIKFTASEIQNWKNVGEMVSSVSSKIDNQ
jgi:acyl carrier protein